MSKTFEEYYSSGKLKTSYLGDEVNQPNGDYIDYYESGFVEAKGKVLGNRKEDEWIFYYEGGEFQAGGAFKNGYKDKKWQYNIDGLPKTIEWDIFEDKKGRFGINYPIGWEISHDIPNLAFVAKEVLEDNVYGSTINVFITIVPENNNNLRKHIQQAVERQILSSPVELSLISGVSDELKINNLSAHYCVMKTKNLSGSPLRLIQFYVLNSRQLFVLNFYCEESLLSSRQKLFNEIIFSFRSPY